MKRRIYTLFTFVLTFTISALSQDFTMDLIKDLNPRNIGPAGMSGRVTSIDVVLNNTDIIFAGTASGGLWKSESGGIRWSPIFDNELTASVGAVKIQQSNPSVIWVGTGEGNPRNSLNGGFGIYKSIDGGKTWMEKGLKETRHIHRIVIDPTNPDVIYVGAIGSPWGEHKERGVYKSIDGGNNWKKILFTNNKSGAADLVMDPENPNKLIAAMWEHKREPWYFNSGGKGSGLHITHNGGETWKKLSSKEGLPEGDLGRIGIAIAPSSPNIVYAIIESKKNALYKSEDGGDNWKKINDKNDIGGRPFYYSEIYVDPQNENRVYSIFTYVNVSEDGGKNFKQLMPAYGVSNGVHPDHHAWWIHPENGKFMIDGNDGGLNITKDGGKSWRFIENLPVAQFYHINVDNEYPYNVYGGMQDNGSWRGPAYVWRDQGIRNSYWQEISFGDGFDVVPDKDDSRYGWTMSQQGFVSRYDWKTGNNYNIQPTHPDGITDLRFNWNSAINIDPFNNSTIYFGSQFVHKSEDKGLTWEIISDDLTTNDPSKLKQSESGGLTMDATGAENHCTILVIEPSEVEKDMLWVGTDDGRVHYTLDGGNSWTEVSKNIKGLPKGSWIPQIKASKTNKGEAILVANDYRRFNYEPYVFRTLDYGKKWSRIVDADDVESYALSIVQDKVSPNLLFLGTDDGLYVSINNADSWLKWTKDFPTVPVKDLVIQERENDLVIGTFGRSAWVIDNINPLRELADNYSLLENKIELFEPSTSILASYQQPTGSRFGGDALYNGENRRSGALISYYFNSKKSNDTLNKEQKDSLFLNIYDGERLIRTLKKKTPKESGFYKWTWRMDEKGKERPSRRIRKNKFESSGVSVKPGNYKIELTFNDEKSYSSINVINDPRVEINSNIDQQYNSLKEIDDLLQKSADVVKQLVESKNTATDFKTRLSKLDKDKFKDEINLSSKMVKQTDSLVALFLGKIDKRQGITRNKESNVQEKIYKAYYYISSRPNGNTITESNLMKHANNSLNKAVKMVNAFFTEKWKSYKEEMDKLEYSEFKDVKQF